MSSEHRSLAPIAEITSELELEEVLSRPTEEDINALSRIDGDILILGAGGKMGPSLARRAVRASRESGSARRVIAAVRSTNTPAVNALRDDGVDLVEVDLLDRRSLDQLPDAENVIFMAGRKFGTSGDESLTWATNAYLPALVADRYRHSRISAWSTGNVYPLSPIHSTGSNEDSPIEPVGEYAQSALARERIFEYFSKTLGTRISLLRLNYAVELRYGVLVDLATKILAGEPIDLSMGAVNLIWQGYANSVCLRSLMHCCAPPFVLNVTSPQSYSVRWLAEQLAGEMGLTPVFAGQPGTYALLSDASRCSKLFGPSPIGIEQLIPCVARWVRSGGGLLNRPTHFEVKEGRF
jgi:nucleoside-diphosphate-sugar epimerase